MISFQLSKDDILSVGTEAERGEKNLIVAFIFKFLKC